MTACRSISCAIVIAHPASAVSRVKGMGIGEVLTAPRSPWQNPRGATTSNPARVPDHVVVPGERQLGRILTAYSRIITGLALTFAREGRSRWTEIDEPPARRCPLSIPEVGEACITATTGRRLSPRASWSDRRRPTAFRSVRSGSSPRRVTREPDVTQDRRIDAASQRCFQISSEFWLKPTIDLIGSFLSRG